MHSIGNEHDALTILHWVRSFPREYGRPKCATSGEAPDGWQFLGKGSFRSVWLSPEGVAYKVEHDPGYSYQSDEEINNLTEAWKRGPLEGCRLPQFERYVVGDDDLVVAIEAIKGDTLYEYDGPEDRDDLYDLLRECEDYYRLGDLHDENAMVDEEGYLVPVDFGG